MNDSIIKLHPQNYKEVEGRLIFYFHENRIDEETFEDILCDLRNSKTFVITSYRKNGTSERRYSLYVGRYVLNFFGSDYLNLHVTTVFYGKKAREKKENLYRTKIFTIIPAGNVFAVYNQQLFPEVEDHSWKMDQDVYNELLDTMERYFDSDVSDDEEEMEERLKVTERFRRNIIHPFRDYTDKENWVEQYKQLQGEGITYFQREFARKNDKGPVYRFYSNDENADPEKSYFTVGDRLTLVDTSQDEHGVYTGVLENIDNETNENAIIFEIAFYHQADDVDFPEMGKLVLAINDTQARVRSKVIRSIERGKVESKYMYRTFDNFSVGGYDEIPDDLKEYLVEKMEGKYPPNQMQLEAIIKGILTEDLLLVLGPPGTGKTTVISFWVEYFIRKGQRVLISSQNNAAVDNVLARFGEMAETVRLGNESKVQENCKPYLPQNKIASMQEHFNSNHERVSNAIEHDIAEIKEYKKKLQYYQSLYDSYFEKKRLLSEYKEKIKFFFERVKKSYLKIDATKKRIEVILNERARDEIFLAVYEKKGFVGKLLKRNYANRIKEQLIRGEVKLKELEKLCLQEKRIYNSEIELLTKHIDDMRQKNAVTDFSTARKMVLDYTKISTTPEFVPNLISELAHLYERPVYPNNANSNMKLIKDEYEQILKIEQSIDKLNRAISDWNEMVNTHRNDIMQNALLETCQIVGATCIGINSNKDFANVKFDVAIVDESGQIQIHNALVPMSRARKNLLLGDYKQIPPCANEDVLAACKAEEIDVDLLNMSFFEYVFEKMRKNEVKQLEEQGYDKGHMLKPILDDYVPESFKKFSTEAVQEMILRVVHDSKKLVNLNSQFRMPGNISDIISEWFYEGNYHSSYDMERFTPMLPGSDKPLVVISTSNAQNRQESQPSSKMGYQNIYEAQLIADIVSDVVNAVPDEERAEFLEKIEDNIGIISAYGAQVRLIRECLSKKKIGVKETQIRSMVASLDSFQGQERPLILYSLTRSTTYKKPEMGRVGFMKELRRLNVAFTRCQKQLVIVGDIDYLSMCMNMEQIPEEGKEWPCMNQIEENIVGQDYIEQCAECPAICERKFARFMRLLMQHVDNGAGNKFDSEQYMERDA